MNNKNKEIRKPETILLRSRTIFFMWKVLTHKESGVQSVIVVVHYIQ